MRYQLLCFVACPVCYNPLFFNVIQKELICNVDNLAFPLKQGILVLLKEKARILSHQNK